MNEQLLVCGGFIIGVFVSQFANIIEIVISLLMRKKEK